MSEDPFNPAELPYMQDVQENLDQMAVESYQLEQAQLERIIKDAILEDYDGVDIHRPNPLSQGLSTTVDVGFEVHQWNYPAPDADNGLRTERYTWDWFDNEELKRNIRNGEIETLMHKLSDTGQSD